jgi:hypothetical protein
MSTITHPKTVAPTGTWVVEPESGGAATLNMAGRLTPHSVPAAS